MPGYTRQNAGTVSDWIVICEPPYESKDTSRVTTNEKNGTKVAVFSDLFYASLRAKITDKTYSKSPVTFIYRKRRYEHELLLSNNDNYLR